MTFGVASYYDENSALLRVPVLETTIKFVPFFFKYCSVATINAILFVNFKAHSKSKKTVKLSVCLKTLLIFSISRLIYLHVEQQPAPIKELQVANDATSLTTGCTRDTT